jgi:hypothetical protein
MSVLGHKRTCRPRITTSAPTSTVDIRLADGPGGPDSEFQKFRLPPDPNQLYIVHRPVPKRGGSRSSRTRDRMRWTRAALQTSDGAADGEVVWS